MRGRIEARALRVTFIPRPGCNRGTSTHHASETSLRAARRTRTAESARLAVPIQQRAQWPHSQASGDFAGHAVGPAVALCSLTMRRNAPASALLSLAVLSHAGVAAAQDYDAAMALAASREATGNVREAAASLDALHAVYPQDFALSLRLGWLWFQAGDNHAARTRYRHALTLSDDTSRDARLGLGWSLLRLHEASAARDEFARLLSLDATDASAREGHALALAALPTPLRVWASLWLGAQAYVNHPQRSWSVSGTASVTAQILDVAVLGLTYRAVDYSVTSTTSSTVQPPPPRPGLPPPPPTTQSRTTTAMNLQQELHVMGGVARPAWALRAHLGRLWDSSNSMAPAWIFGVSGRLALHGELTAELSDTLFADHSAVRAVGAWAASLGGGWSLGPVATAQRFNGSFGGSLGAVAGWRGDGYAASLSARYGDEVRPTSLVEALTFATDDHVRGTLSLSGLVPLSHGLSLALRYDGLLLTTSASAGAVDASAHFFTAALTGAW